MEQVIMGVPAAVIITLLVEVLKRFKVVEGDQAIAAAIGIGIVLSVAVKMAAIYPGFETWFIVMIQGLLTGLIACGLYDGSKAVRERLSA